MEKRAKRPRDTNQLAKMVVDLSVGEISEPDPNIGKDPMAVKRGRLGGARGGKSRAAALDHQRRIEVITTTFNLVPQLLIGTTRVATLHLRLATFYHRYLPLKFLTPPIEIP